MIRQAISCDLCGNEKRQTNHWFVAYQRNGELRVSGWNSRIRLRPGTKHLCGQTCLHKLLDDFMARDINQKCHQEAQAGAETNSVPAARTSKITSAIDTSLTSRAAYDEVESSARLITAATKDLQLAQPKAGAEVVTMNGRKWIDSSIPSFEEPRPTSRSRSAEAWRRERERGLRLQERQGDLSRKSAG